MSVPSLDDLFADAIAATQRKRILTYREVDEALDRLRRTQSARYRNPANWERGRAVHLLSPSGADLGFFGEYRNKFDPSLRRLVREDTPTGADALTVEVLKETASCKTRLWF